MGVWECGRCPAAKQHDQHRESQQPLHQAQVKLIMRGRRTQVKHSRGSKQLAQREEMLTEIKMPRADDFELDGVTLQQEREPEESDHGRRQGKGQSPPPRPTAPYTERDLPCPIGQQQDGSHQAQQIVREHNRRQGQHARRQRPPTPLLAHQATKGIEGQGQQANRKMLRQGTTGVRINEHHVGREGERSSRQHTCGRAKQITPQQIGPQRSDEETQDKHRLDPTDDVHAGQQVKQIGQVISQWGVVIKDWVAVTEIEVWSPTRIENAAT